jgi:regulator of sirC expression with transglutaminase-like and TPR domain
MNVTAQEIAARVKPSVVVITFEGRDGEEQGLGSGFIVASDGLIATNLHVIGEARPIRVRLHDRREFAVTSIHATDRVNDLAVLKIDATELPVLPLGESTALPDGEPVLTVGNPLGLERSVVTGVLSGRRDVDGRPMLQIAMPIERGNSGGPLLDLQGRVQGLITLKSLKTENLGFAIPVEALRSLLDDPNPIAMTQWLTIGVLDPTDWTTLFESRWKQRAGRILVDGAGGGLGGRGLCFSTATPPAVPYEVAVSVRFEPTAGAAGLVFHADGGDRHYGFYPSNGELRLSRFDGPDVYAWNVLAQVKSTRYRPDGWNHLKVRVEADRLRCYLNDELVIESRDTTFTTGRIGLCKFRETEAEFKEFRVGAMLPDREPTAELRTQAQAVAATLPLDRPAEDTAIEPFLATGATGLEALEREARDLEARAKRVRQFASAVHDARIRAEFARVVEAEDGPLDLLRGALLIAAADNPDLDPEAYLRTVEQMSERVRRKLPDQADDVTRLAALKRDLFEEQGFHGCRHDYGHRSNSYLNEVIDDREGLPITLSVLFLELGRRLEIPLEGVGLPGHFVVRFTPAAGASRLIDVFDQGSELTLEEAQARVRENLGEWDDAYLAAASSRAILSRMLRNLFSEARNVEDHERMLRYTQLVLILEPNSSSDRFYRAVLAYQTQRYPLAKEDLAWLRNHDLDGLPRRAVEDLSRAVEQAAP